MAKVWKMQNTGEKQLAWTKKMLDDLISSFENFKALMELKDKYKQETNKHNKR